MSRSQPKPTRADTVEAIIGRHHAIRAAIDREDDEDKVAKLCAAEDRLLLKLARRRERSDDAFFSKIAYLASQAVEVDEPIMQHPFGAVMIAVSRHLEHRA